MARIGPETIVELAREAMAPDAEALFVSCTALRAAVSCRTCEAALGKPVVSSEPGNRLELSAVVRRRRRPRHELGALARPFGQG